LKGSKLRKRQKKFKHKLINFQKSLDNINSNFERYEKEDTEKSDQIETKINSNFEKIYYEIEIGNKKFQNI